MVRAVCCCALLLVASPLLPRTAWADDDPRAQAAVHYTRGIELAEQGLYAAALEQFRAAYEKSPHFAVLYNIGQAQMALGRPIEAIEALSRYLRDGAEQVPLSRREQVQAQVSLLESRLAELSVTTDRPGAQVTVDGREVGKTPLFQPIRMASGAHTVSVAMEGVTPIVQKVELREGERQALAFVIPVGVAPKPAPATLPAASLIEAPPPPAPPRDLRKWAYASGVVGVVTGAAALGIYIWNRNQYDQWQATNRSLGMLTPGTAAYHNAAAANNARADSLTSANRTIIGLSLASGVLIAGGAALYFVDRSHRREQTALAFDVAVGSDWSPRVVWSATW
ncbi:MAG TPA: PEGA domain-containing protein [Polyangia bacterium]|nr:PEGA domain-containing protein [Polyangia bacterium]